MADSSSRRRSPESSRRRRRERRAASRERTNATTAAFAPSVVPAPTTNYYDASTPGGPTMQDRSAPIDIDVDRRQNGHCARPASSSSGSSSTSSSLLDISRRYSGQQKYGGVFQTFFRAPSERRRLRRRRSGKKKKRVLYFGNSSSSSLNSDLAYGQGYIPRRKSSRDFSQRHHHQNSAPVAAAAAAGATYASMQNQGPLYPQGPSQYAPSHGHSQSYSHPPPQNMAQDSTSWGPGATAATAAAAGAAVGLAADYYNQDRQIPSKPATPRRRKTDEEIMAIGRQLSDLAKAQNEGDLRAAGISKPSGLVSAATKFSDYRKSKYGGSSRGIGGSKMGVDSSSDDSDWESASDDDSEDSADSDLAFGTVVSAAIRPTAAAAAGAAAGAAMASGTRDQSGRSAVDPRLFGPVNSLHGMVTPRPFDDNGKPITREPRPLTRSATEPMGPMRNVYPMATSDPNRFDITSGDLPHRARPGPVPLQQPTPRQAVSPKVYEAEKLEDATRRVDKSSRRSEESGWGGAAAAGVAAGLVGAALTKDRKDDKESRDYRDEEKRDREKRSERSDKRDKEKDKRREKDRERDREREKDEKRKSKSDSFSSKYPDEKDRDKDRKRSSKYDDRDDSKKSRDVPYESTRESHNRRSKGEPDDGRSELSQISRRDSSKFNLPAKYNIPQEPRQLPGPEKAGFYQATDPNNPLSKSAVDPFQYQVEEFAKTPSDEPPRPLTPNVFTVAREPVWDSTDDELPQGRLSRKDSFEIEQMVEENRKRRTPDEQRSASDYVTSKAEHAVAPVGVAAMAGAIVAEGARSRDRKRDAYSDNGSEVRTSPRDAVQDEADKYYREAELARKIASDRVRSREHSPDRSVVDKYDQDDNVRDVPTIVTPPEYKQHEHKNEDHHADFKLDNRWTPSEAAKYTGILNEPVRDAERERPYLNLIYPTPASSRKPTPAIEQQEEKSRSADRDFKDDSEKDRSSRKKSGKSRDLDRDENSRSEVGSSKRRTKDRDERSSKSEVGVSSSRRRRTRDFEDETSKSDAGAVVVVGPDGDIQTPKSVSWGQNRTDTFEVVTPEPREDRELGGSKTRPQLDKASQWGAIATAIAANSREPRNEPDAMVTESPKEMDSGSRSRDMPVYHVEDTPPVPGPKPASPGPQQMPGGFADDIEFAATLAAGLEKTGFDANMVIDDPTYRRRDSPPGSDELNGNGVYQKPFSETVSDFQSREPQPGPSEPGFVLGEVETPGDSSRAVEPTDEWAEAPTKLSKKERKRQEKLKKKQEAEAALETPVEAPEPPPAAEEEPPIQLSKKEQRKRDKEARARALASQDDEIYAEPEQIKESETFEDAWEEPSGKKKSRSGRDFDDGATSVSVPVDAFADLTSSRDTNPDDEWAEDKKSRKSKRDSKSYDSMSKSVDDLRLSKGPEREDEWDEMKKSKKKSKRDSLIYDSPSRSVTDLSKIVDPEDEGDDTKSRRKSKRDSGAYDSPSRSAAASEAGSEVSRKSSKKSKRKSGTEDDFNGYDHPPDRGRDPFEDRDVSSVVSEPRDDKRSSRRSYRYDDDDDAKSVASAPGGGRSKKISEKRSSGGLFSSIFKKDDDKKNKESFLDNAGTLGAGVGLAGVGIAAADSLSRYNATEALSEKKDPSEEIADWSRGVQDGYDQGIVARTIKPAIDPQYGDLLPLPPSEPGSPVKSPEEELPSLPESRPDTPPEEQNFRYAHARRKSAQETPAKSPSNTAIPFQLRLGNRSGPSSPAFHMSSPVMSPAPGMPESPGSARKSRPTSWDDSREYKPLYLLEHNRKGPQEDPIDQADLPALPPSEASSRSSPGPGSEAWESADEYAHGGYDETGYGEPTLRLDTSIPAFTPGHDHAGSQETTPKAEIKPEFPDVSGTGAQEQGQEPDPIEPMSKDRSSYLLQSAPSSTKSNKTVDDDTVARNLRDIAETPSKPGNKDSLANLDDNFTSADEHFSDAREEDKDSGSPSRSRDLSVDTPSEAVTAPETPAEQSSADATPAPEEPAEDFSMLTGKAKKKAKKAAKKKQVQALDVSAPSEEPETAEAATAKDVPVEQAEPEVEKVDTAPTEQSHEPASEQPAAEEPPAEPQDAFETPKKGKKGKKDKKKASTWEDDLPAAAGAAAIVAGATAAAVAASEDEPKAADDKALDESNDSVPKSAEEPQPITSEDTAERGVEQQFESPQQATGDEALAEVPAEHTAKPEAPAEPEAVEDTWGSTGKKSKKKKKKGKAALSLDEEPAPVDKSAPESEPTVVEEAAPEPEPASAETPATTEGTPEDPTPSADPEQAVEPTPEPAPEEPDAWEATSKKSKKKKKKGKAPLPEEDEPAAVEGSVPEPEATPVDEATTEKSLPANETAEPVEQAVDDGVAKETETVAVDDTPGSNEPIDDAWSAPPLSKKEKKKQKKKALQTDDSWIKAAEGDVSEPTAEPVAPEAEVETSTNPADTEQAPQDSAVAAQEDTTAIAEEPAQAEEEFAPASKKKKKKDKKKALQLQLDTPEEPKPSDDKDLSNVEEPLTAIAATGDDASAWDQTLEDKESTPQIAEAVGKGAGERDLQPEVSEPFFSQDEPSAATTQDPTTQSSEVFAAEKDVPEPAESSWEAPSSKKSKKDKKKKKKQEQQAEEQKLKNEAEEPEPEPKPESESQVPTTAWARDTDEAQGPVEASYLEPIAEDEEGQASHDWQRYERRYPEEEYDWEQYEQEAEPAKPADDGWDMDDDFFSKPTPKEEVTDDLGWDKPQPAAGEQDELSEDEWSTLVTGKKAKKNKNKQEKLSMEKALDLVQEPDPEASASGDVPPEQEHKEHPAEDDWATPTKKSKKQKKKDKAASSWDEEPSAADKSSTSLDEPGTEETRDDDALDSAMQEGMSTPRPPSSGTDATEIWLEAESEMPEESKSQERSATTDDNNDFLFPAKLSKKDKKKKKKQAALEAASAEDDKPAEATESEKKDSLDVESVAGTTDDSPENTSGFVTPAESVSGEANPDDDEWGGFSSKKSKKEKKKKKAKDSESEKAQEPPTAEAPTENIPEPESQDDRGLDVPTAADDNAGFTNDEPTVAGDGSEESQPAEQEQESGLSKKEKKKQKKKAKALAFDVSDEASPGPDVTTDTQPEEQDPAREEPPAGDDLTSGISTKDKKKKRKSVTFDLGDTPAPGDEKEETPVETEVVPEDRTEIESPALGDVSKDLQAESESQQQQDVVEVEDPLKEDDTPSQPAATEDKPAAEGDTEDPWAAPLSKKDKKKKKKAEQAAAAAALLDSSPSEEVVSDSSRALEPDTKPSTDVEVTPQTEETQAEDVSTREPEVVTQDTLQDPVAPESAPAAEDDDSWMVGLSKSQIKKRKKAMAAAAEAAAATRDSADMGAESAPASEETTEAARSSPSEDKPIEEGTEASPPKDASEEIEATPLAEPEAIATRATSSEDKPTDEETGAEPPKDVAGESEATPLGEPEEPTVRPSEGANDDWSAGLSKKEKKKKKKAAKAQGFDDWEPTTETEKAPEEARASQESESQSQPDVAPTSEESVSVPEKAPEEMPASRDIESQPQTDITPSPEEPTSVLDPSPDVQDSANDGDSPKVEEPLAEPRTADVPAEPTEDDESWAVGLSKSQKKKRKKQMEKEKAEKEAQEALAEPVPRPVSEAAIPGETETSIEPTESAPEPVESAETVPAQSDEKPEPSEPGPEPTPPVEEEQELQAEPGKPEESVTIEPATATEAPLPQAEDDESWAIGLSKKEKKKRKKQMDKEKEEAAARALEATDVSAEEPPAKPTEFVPADPAVDPVDNQIEPVAEAADTDTAVAEDTSAASPEEVAADDDWSAGLSKKEKKKKKKAMALAMDWDTPTESTEPIAEAPVATEPETSPPDAAAEVSTQPEDIAHQQPETPDEPDTSKPSVEEAPTSAPALEEDDWSVGLPKKDKKKKKKAKAQAFDWDEPTESEATKPTQDADEPPIPSTEAEQTTVEPELALEPPREVEISEPPADVGEASTTPVVDDEDEFAGLSNKEKKKRKKAKAKALAEAESIKAAEPQPEEPSQVQEDPATTEEPDTPPEAEGMEATVEAQEPEASAEPGTTETSEGADALAETKEITEPEPTVESPPEAEVMEAARETQEPEVSPESGITETSEAANAPAETKDIAEPVLEEADEFAGLSKKEKKKKLKKAKAQALAWDEPAEPSEPEALKSTGQVEEMAPTEPEAIPDTTQDVETAATAEAAAVPSEDAAKPVLEEEDEYAGLSNKEKKKRKKAKAQALAWDESTEPSQPEAPESTSQVEQVLPITSEAIPETNQEVETVKTAEEASVPSEDAAKPVFEEEDEYAGLSNKEKKKRKKAKEKALAMPRVPPSEEPSSSSQPSEELPTDHTLASDPVPEETHVEDTKPSVTFDQPKEEEAPEDSAVAKSTEAHAEPPEDDWGFGLSKKEKKKKKKEKAKLEAMDWEPTPEPAQEASAPEEPQDSDKPADMVETSESPAVAEAVQPKDLAGPYNEDSVDVSGDQPQDPAEGVEPDAAAPEVPVEPAADDAWGFGLSKKDKKKKKKQQKAQALDFDMDAPAEVTKDTAASEDPDPTEAPAPITSEDSVPDGVRSQVEQEPEASHTAVEETTAESPAEDPSDKPTDVPAEPPVETTTEIPVPDDDWATGLSKKDKKKKKKEKSRAIEMGLEPAVETAPEPTTAEASAESSSFQPSDSFPETVVDPNPSVEELPHDSTAQSTETPTEAPLEDDNWGFGLSKKDKKKKKKAKAAGLDWESTVETPADMSKDTSETAAEEAPPTAASPEAEKPEGETSNVTSEQVSEPQPTSEATTSVEQAEPLAGEQPVDKPPVEEDTWDPAPSKKDKKKKKKGKALDFSAWDEPGPAQTEPTAPAEDVVEPRECQDVDLPQEPTAESQPEPEPEPAQTSDEPSPLAGLSKKEKKKLKKQALAKGLPDPFAETGPAEETPSGEASISHESEDVTKPAEPEEPPMENVPAEVTIEEGEKETETLDRSALQVSEQETSQQPEPTFTVEDATELPREDENPIAAVEQPFDTSAEAPEPEDWLPTKKSKKEKKKAQKAAALAATLAAGNEPWGESSVEPKEAESRPVAEEIPVADDKPSDDILPADDRSTEPAAPSIEPTEEQPTSESAGALANEPQPPAEEDFGFTVSTKKSKKDKKKKKQAALDLGASPPETEEPKEIVEPQDSAPSDIAPQPQEETSQPDSSHVAQPTEPTTADEDEWAMPSKKSKKAKKLKASKLAMFEPQNEEHDSSRDPDLEEVPSLDKSEDNITEQKEALDTKIQTLEDSQQDNPSATVGFDEHTAQDTSADVAEPPVEATEASPDDFWAMPSSKKSKKGKKRESLQTSPPDTARAPTPPQDVTAAPISDEVQPSESQVPQEAAPDDWAEGFATTKSKKKKKNTKAMEQVTAASDTVDLGPSQAQAQAEPDSGLQETIAAADRDLTMGEIEPKESVPLPEESRTEGHTTVPSMDIYEQSWQFPSESKDITMDDVPVGAAEPGITLEKEVPIDDKSKSSNIGKVVTAGAAAAGVAAVAEKASPGKKGKKGKKNKKSIDKRQPQEDDIFDDPSLWENADKRNLQEREEEKADDDFWGEGEKTKGQLAAKENDDFWGGGEDEDDAENTKLGEVPSTPKPADTWDQPDVTAPETEDAPRSLQTSTARGFEATDKDQPGAKSKDLTVTPQSESFSGSDGGWKETAQRGAPLDDYEYDESPVLGRGDQPSSRSGPVGLLRRDFDMEDPVGGLLREDSQASALSGPLGSDFGGTRLSPARSLPGIQEVPEAEGEATSTRGLPQTPDLNRDSGYVESPRSSFRSRSRSHLFVDQGEQDQPRDSGYHGDDWDELPARSVETPKSHKKLSRSSHGTPKLQEPVAPQLTPEPEKKSSKSRKTVSSDNYEQSPLRSSTSRDLRDAPLLRSSKSRTERDLQSSPSLRSMKSRDYGDLRSESAKKPSALPVAAPAASSTSQRSVSDNSHNVAQPRRQDSQPQLRRSLSNTSLARKRTPEPLKFRPESPGIHGQAGSGVRSTPTPPLRRVDKRVSGDLRSLRQQPSHPALPSSASTSTPTPTPDAASSQSVPVANEGRVRSKDMADVYDGFGEGRMGSPRSPTRPHSMRRRQSMQVLELESRVEQLMAENRLLTDARTHAEQNLSQRATSILTERDSEIEALKQSLQFLQNEVSRLTEVNEGLTSANAELAQKDNGRYADLEVRYADTSRELDEARGAHNTFEQSLQDKDAEIADLRAQLEDAKEQVRAMQRQILASKAGDSDFLDVLDEDHFDNRCQQLCSHVQQWVLRFSKFSDMRACRLTGEINDEKTIDRLDNAVLDGSDVDRYLSDRVKRRDIFMSMTMNMIWEFVFTRYLFGMDREQRQKLKSLEKMLTEVGPPQAVRQWRAVTLTLLARRDNFKQQKDQDTEAVVQAIFQTLCKILPPPGNLENQIQSQLRRVLREAVDLSIEMRTQKAEYMMLPPLQPEYDSEGELAATVQFNASMMNERSGKNASSNEDLEAEGAVVRVVLFPLVVKKGDDAGVGDEEIVVCPAQVVVATKGRRSFAPSSDAGGASLGGRSHISVVTEHMGG